MVWVGTDEMVGTKIYQGIQYCLRRNSVKCIQIVFIMTSLLLRRCCCRRRRHAAVKEDVYLATRLTTPNLAPQLVLALVVLEWPLPCPRRLQ